MDALQNKISESMAEAFGWNVTFVLDLLLALSIFKPYHISGSVAVLHISAAVIWLQIISRHP